MGARQPRTKWVPLDVFLISGPMNSGAEASKALLQCLAHHPAVRSYGMVTYDRPEYAVQAIEYIRAGKINTMFIDLGPAGETEPGFDAAPYIAKLREQYPHIIFVLYTGSECRESFITLHPRFNHYFYLNPLDPEQVKAHPSDDTLNRILEQCEEWHTDLFEFDVALSYADEDKRFARSVAARLVSEGARVFYDKREQANLTGEDLAERLSDIYSNRCRYCVLLSSKPYAETMWTSPERRPALEKALADRGNEFILPVRIDETQIPGLSDLTGYVKATEGAEKIVARIVQKLWITNPRQVKGSIGSSPSH